MTEPLISIIVPVYKTEKYLPQCIESILAQTYKNLEIILIDDGSPDNCGAICDKYAAQDMRIVVIHKENGGVSSARNAGLKIAKGEYIGFVDSDDYIAPDMYEYLYGLMAREHADISMCNLYEQKQTGWVATKHIRDDYRLIRPFELLELGSWAYNPLKLFAHRVLKNIYFDEATSYNEDSWFIIEVLQQVSCVALGNKPCYYYHNRIGSSSHVFIKTHLGKLKIGEKLLAFAKKNHLPKFYNTIQKSQYVCASTWLGLLAQEENPDKESIQILQSYCRQNLWRLLRQKEIKFTKKCFLIVACMNCNVASKLAKKLYSRNK